MLGHASFRCVPVALSSSVKAFSGPASTRVFPATAKTPYGVVKSVWPSQLVDHPSSAGDQAERATELDRLVARDRVRLPYLVSAEFALADCASRPAHPLYP